MRPVLATLLILTAATGAWAHDDDAHPKPPSPAIEVPPSADAGDVIPLLADVPDGAKLAWAVIPTTEGLTLILAVSTPEGVVIESQTITVKRPPPGEDPDDDDSPVNEKVIQAWLDAVPTDAREVAVVNPISGASATRQQNVGKTFREIGSVAKLLGSIAATNVMLGTGLSASYGDGADDWAPFDAAARKALSVMAAEGANATEYGAALTLIGEVLR